MSRQGYKNILSSDTITCKILQTQTESAATFSEVKIPFWVISFHEQWIMKTWNVEREWERRKIATLVTWMASRRNVATAGETCPSLPSLIHYLTLSIIYCKLNVISAFLSLLMGRQFEVLFDILTGRNVGQNSSQENKVVCSCLPSPKIWDLKSNKYLLFIRNKSLTTSIT